MKPVHNDATRGGGSAAAAAEQERETAAQGMAARPAAAIEPEPGATAPGPGVLRLGAGGEIDERAYGAKAATLHSLALGGAAVPAGFALAPERVSELVAGAPEAEAAARAAIADLEARSGRVFGAGPAPLRLALRLSPETPLADVAPAVLGIGAFADERGAADPAAPALQRSFAQLARLAMDAPESARLADPATAAPFEQLRAAATLLDAAWRAPRARRRRIAVDASERCGLVVQSLISDLIATADARLYDPATGDETEQFRLLWRADGAPLKSAENPFAVDGPVRDAARAALRQAEIAAKRPLALELALDAAGAVWILAAEPLRASPAAELRIIARMVAQARVDREDALLIPDPLSLESLLHRSIADDAPRDVLAVGIAASPGAAAGRLAFSAEAVAAFERAGEPAILARSETYPEDVQGIHAAAGVLTTRGGLTSHAAVVARGLGKPCVVGVSDARIDADDDVLPTGKYDFTRDAQTEEAPPPAAAGMTAPGGRKLRQGDWVTLDGATGEILAGAAPTIDAAPSGALAELMRWADAERRMAVRANADTKREAEIARNLGVDGLGLCRTEHMFVDPKRLTVMREMILADGETERRAALAKLLPMQRADFAELFRIMGDIGADGRAGSDADPNAAAAPGARAAPITIRLLDPPLHEFLPEGPRELAALAQALGQPVAKIVRRARALREFNPMLGKRGCRVGVAYPEIYEMQARAIFEAALDVEDECGRAQAPEIMIPLVSAARELERLRAVIEGVARSVAEEQGRTPRYRLGIMIETPRAALRAGPLAAFSAFVSFGTNDLTQMTYGLSRDDAGGLMRDYVAKNVFEADPFQSLDQEGVGELILLGVDRARAARPEIAVGLCGEHGGEPRTIAFCEDARFDYVSCSPYRTPIARLAAAQAAIRARRRAR